MVVFVAVVVLQYSFQPEVFTQYCFNVHSFIDFFVFFIVLFCKNVFLAAGGGAGGTVVKLSMDL